MSSKHTPTELIVGLFVLAGIGSLAYLSVSIGGIQLFDTPKIYIQARFASVGDLQRGAAVKMAGVKVGSVGSIELKNYQAEVKLAVNKSLPIPTDTIASIRTEGLLGESYILLRPGGELDNLQTGGQIAQTEPAIDLIDLLVRYALEGGSDDSAEAEDKNNPPDLF